MRGGTSPEPEIHYPELENLGFNEDELDRFFDDLNRVYDEEDIKNRYLEIARYWPYSQRWQTIDDAKRAPEELDVLDERGEHLTKSDIADDVITHFYTEITRGAGKRRTHKKSRKTKRSKRKSQRRRHTRKYRK